MDRNHVVLVVSSGCWVALRKESVDRNRTPHHKNTRPIVALRKESVDRNGIEVNGVSYDVWSLSARRAWIEIVQCRL